MSDAEPTLYEQIGGDAVVRALVDRFYDAMDELPEARRIRDLHPADLGSSRDKLYQFLSGWLGGPQLYVERHGHPRLRARHLPFPIAEAERDAWLICFLHACDAVALPAAPREQILRAIARLADHMRNRASQDD